MGVKFVVSQIILFMSFIILGVLLYFMMATSSPVKISMSAYNTMRVFAVTLLSVTLGGAIYIWLSRTMI